VSFAWRSWPAVLSMAGAELHSVRVPVCLCFPLVVEEGAEKRRWILEVWHASKAFPTGAATEDGGSGKRQRSVAEDYSGKPHKYTTARPTCLANNGVANERPGQLGLLKRGMHVRSGNG